jgi:bifunctional non-homologous end joining protein LigD
VAGTRKKDTTAKIKAGFIEPMLLLRTERLPEGAQWLYEIKFDGYRVLALKSGGNTRLLTRNNKDYTARYPMIAAAMRGLPDETVIDGEVIALDDEGRPSFHLLQNSPSAKARLLYCIFDVLVLEGRDVMGEPLTARRQLLEERVLPDLDGPVRYSPELNASLKHLIQSVKAQGLEGLVAKRRDGKYEPGDRSGTWQKMRVNLGQEFVIGGYTLSGDLFDALIFGYYEGGKLIYAARTRNGFTTPLRRKLMKHLRALQTEACPFANLPEKQAGRWGAGLTAAKMADCRWVKPELVGQFEFLEWTADNHLRHCRFIGLREDKKSLEIMRETPH